MRRGDGILQSVALISLAEFARHQSARVPARPGKTGTPRRRAIEARSAVDSPVRFARKWRRKRLKSLDSRKEMAPCRARRPQARGLLSSIRDPLRVARKRRRKGLKSLNPRRETARPTGACCVRSAVVRPMRVAGNSRGGRCGGRAAPTGFVPTRPSPSAMGLEVCSAPPRPSRGSLRFADCSPVKRGRQQEPALAPTLWKRSKRQWAGLVTSWRECAVGAPSIWRRRLGFLGWTAITAANAANASLSRSESRRREIASRPETRNGAAIHWNASIHARKWRPFSETGGNGTS